jgi:hypothetical protein
MPLGSRVTRIRKRKLCTIVIGTTAALRSAAMARTMVREPGTDARTASSRRQPDTLTSHSADTAEIPMSPSSRRTRLDG